jgi:hypothetical protein
LRRNSQKQLGLSFAEALEMAYENIQEEARTAVKGVKRPKERSSEGNEGIIETRDHIDLGKARVPQALQGEDTRSES